MASKSSKNSPEPEHDGWSNRTKIILGLIAFVAFVIAYLFAVYWVPRWWAGVIASIVDGRVAFGGLLGGAVGFIFTLVPILAFLAGLRMRKTWKGIIGSFVVAVVLALPNILTLGVLAGNGKAAEAARFTLFKPDGAPGFTVGTYVGIALGVAAGLWTTWITYSRRRAKRKAEALEREHTAKLDSMADAHESARDSQVAAPDSSNTGTGGHDSAPSASDDAASDSTDDAASDSTDDAASATTSGSDGNGSPAGASHDYDEITDDDTRS